MFNLQVKPPSFLFGGSGHRRRLLGDPKLPSVNAAEVHMPYSFYEFFSTESPAAEKMSGNFFYSLVALFGATALQFSVLLYFKHKKITGEQLYRSLSAVRRSPQV